MKHIRTALLLAVLLPVAAMAQNIRNVTYAKDISKEIHPAGAISVAGSDGVVTLTGDGKTGARITVHATGPVTFNGGFTVQPGATLHVLAGNARESVQTIAATINPKTGLVLYPNPALNTVNISLPPWNGKVKKELVVTDLSGRQVWQQTMQPGTTELDV